MLKPILKTFKGMQTKIALSFYPSLYRTTIIKKSNDNQDWRRCGKRTLVHCWWECKLVYPLWKSTQRFLKKNLEMEPYETQLFNSWAYTQRTLPQRWLLTHNHYFHCLQQLGSGASLDAHQLMNRQRKCSTYTMKFFIQLYRKMTLWNLRSN